MRAWDQRDPRSTKIGTRRTYSTPRQFASGSLESTNTLSIRNDCDWCRYPLDQRTRLGRRFSVDSHPSVVPAVGTGFIDNKSNFLADNCNSLSGSSRSWSNHLSRTSRDDTPSPILHYISLPIALKAPEEMYHAVRHYTASRIESRLIPENVSSSQEMSPQPKLAVSRRRRLKSPECCTTFADAVYNGFLLTKLGPKPMAASLDQALREIEPLLQSHHFSIIQLMTNCINKKRQVFEAYPYISEMLLKQCTRPPAPFSALIILTP